MKWYCTDLDENGFFKLHVETKYASAWKRMKMTPQFWWDVRELKEKLRPSFRGLLIIQRCYV